LRGIHRRRKKLAAPRAGDVGLNEVVHATGDTTRASGSHSGMRKMKRKRLRSEAGRISTASQRCGFLFRRFCSHSGGC
jgi:hypothetical protein